MRVSAIVLLRWAVFCQLGVGRRSFPLCRQSWREGETADEGAAAESNGDGDGQRASAIGLVKSIALTLACLTQINLPTPFVGKDNGFKKVVIQIHGSQSTRCMCMIA